MSNPIKITRYHAEESDFSKAGRTRCHVTVPAQAGFTDLTTSKVVLDMHWDIENAIKLPCTFGANQLVGGAQALIRNSKARSKQNGLLNERRHQNVISANLDTYTKSRARESADALFGGSTNMNSGNDAANYLPQNPWLEYGRPSAAIPIATAAATPTVSHRSEAHVPFKHIDNFGSMSQFPNLAVGDMSYEIEFENQIEVGEFARMPYQPFHAVQDQTATAGGLIGTAANPLVLDKPYNAWSGQRPKVGQRARVLLTDTTAGAARAVVADYVSVVSEGIGGVTEVILENGVSVGAAAANDAEHIFACFHDVGAQPEARDAPLQAANRTLATDALYGGANNPIVITQLIHPQAYEAQNPFYVGAPIRVVGRNTTTNLTWGEDAIIEEVEIVGQDIHIRVVTPFGPGAGAAIGNVNNNIRVGFRNDVLATGVPYTRSWVIDEVYLEMHELQLTPGQREKALKALDDLELPFVDQLLVQRNMDTTTEHTEVVQAPVNCMSLAVLTPQNLTLLSGFDNCTRYRYSIDGVATTNRDIDVGAHNVAERQLHNHMLKKYFGNQGQRLMKYDREQNQMRAPDNKTTAAFYPLVLPMRPVPQIVQIQLFATNQMLQKSIFWVFSCQKSLKLQRGRAMVV